MYDNNAVLGNGYIIIGIYFIISIIVYSNEV